MSRRRHQPDSLELLLDTMCNTFGGIIMIALLIALLSRDASSSVALSERAEALSRQIRAAQNQTTEAERLQQQMRRSADPASAVALDLLTQRDALRTQTESEKQTILSNTAALASIPKASEATDIQRLLTQFQTQSNELQTVQRQLDRELQSHQRELRLPRERVTGKKNFYFIVRYGKIYPVHIMRDGRRELNTQTLDWTSTSDGDSPRPQPTAGIDAASLPALARLISEIAAETYSIHFLVYDDSFPAFLAARQIPLARNYDVGWEFLPGDKPVVFSSRGEAPPAL